MQTLSMTSTAGRLLQQQGVGQRARTLRNRMIRRAIGLVALALGLSLVHVWTRITVLELRYAMTDIARRVEGLKKEIGRAELAVTALKAPERLEAIAKDQLGLQPPGPGQVIFVQEEE